MPGRVDGPELAGADLPLGPALDPVVRVFPLLRAWRTVARSAQLLRELKGPHAPQVGGEPSGTAVYGQRPRGDQVRLLPRAERDTPRPAATRLAAARPGAAQGPAQLDGERVMIAVRVGDEVVADIPEVEAEVGESCREPLPGVGESHAGVDQVDPVLIGDRVYVDRLEPGHRQWE